MKLEVDLKLSPAQLAEVFADLDDERQAQFFIEVAKIAAAWEDSGMQWFSVGRHLRNCACSSDEARSLVRDIANGLEGEEGREG